MIEFPRRRAVFLAAVAAVTSALSCGPAGAILLSSSGGEAKNIQVRSNNAATKTSSTAFVDLPGATVTRTIVASQDLFVARFAAESRCFGSASGRCVIRVLARNQRTGGLVEMFPPSGVDNTFDTDVAGFADDQEENHAMERSLRLPKDTYTLKVQIAVTNAATVFFLDDWHFSVTTYE